ncbi:MAG: twin-arginine translocation signal domain-containing protein [Spirochaetes bacterium]|nr:twin-arginine translocation signal domain-containing protein [Spirochaetota bacterium]
MTRRKFIKACFAAAGLTALGGCSRTWANGTPGQGNVPGISRGSSGQRPSYLALEASGELERRERALWAKMENCDLCPRRCYVNRMAGEKGACSVADTFRVASTRVGFGEERLIVGRGGTGEIFFSNCNLLCIFCQNWTNAHRGDGRPTTPTELASMMRLLQFGGAININLITPTHLTPHIVTALRLAIAQGLSIPLIYNTSGYETLEVMQLLDGIIDIYQPDFKFQDSNIAIRFLNGAPNYTEYTATAIKEMHRQVGLLREANGTAYRGLLVRHLVLPENLAGTDTFVRWVVSELGVDTHVNIMAQFWPAFQSRYFPPLDRRLIPGEFEQAMRWAREAGLHNFH